LPSFRKSNPPLLAIIVSELCQNLIYSDAWG